MSEIIIRPIKYDEYPIVASIVNEELSNRTVGELSILWKWRHNKTFSKLSDSFDFIVAEKNSQIVGVHGLYPLRMKIGNEIVSMACMSDFVVKKNVRKMGVGRKIRIKILSDEISPFTVSTSSNTHGNKITKIFGGKEVVESKNNFIKPLNLIKLLKEKLSGSKLGESLFSRYIIIVLSKFLNIYFKAGRNPVRYQIVQDVSIEDITFFDERFDMFWKDVSTDYPVLFVRDSAYLNWRYIRYPLVKHESFCLTQNKIILGFAVLYIGIDNKGLKFTSILELLTPIKSINNLNHLLHEVIDRAIRENCDYIKAISSNKSTQKILQKYGFRIRKMAYAPYTYKNNGGYSEKLLTNPNNWHISLGDGDMSFY